VKSTDFSKAILTLKEFVDRELPERESVVDGLLREESITAVNGYTGLGKTMISLAIANEVAWGGSVGPWSVPDPRNVLYVDAEMVEQDLKQRVKSLNKGRQMGRQPGTLHIYSNSYAYKIGLRSADILNKKWRQSILDSVDDLDIGLLVLDNLSSLARGIDENDKAAFDPINEWLIQVRNHGIAIMVLHHTGKNKSEQRGTSAHLDNLDTSLLIERPRGYKDNMGCRLLVTATKDRGQVLSADSYIIQLDTMPSGRLRFTTEAVEGINYAREVIRKDPTMTYHEAAELGISQTTFYRAQKQLKDEGVVKDD
jgi:putative DNA primase/helicase